MIHKHSALIMFSLAAIPSISSLFTAYASISTFLILIQPIVYKLIPYQLQVYLLSLFQGLLGQLSSSDLTIVIKDFEGFSCNQVYEASEVYLRTKIDLSVERLKVSKVPRDNALLVTIEKGQEIHDIFEGIPLKWKLVTSDEDKSNPGAPEKRALELSFQKKYKEKVLSSYLPFVLERSKVLKEENKVVKLYSLGNGYGEMDGPWGSINLDHPSTFDTLAMDVALKTQLISDLNRFRRRKDYYKRVGKAWKRGYLLYGPPGTGKSSLVAAIANYLKFDIYDLELSSIGSDSQLRSLLTSTANQSILVIEDIDCTTDARNQEYGDGYLNSMNKFSLSGLLNFIDGLWSSCGDERIIIFTSNHKDKLDPALLRPGRMDMHIHMSYCTFEGFKILASNYLSIQDHQLLGKIKTLLETMDVTPAEIAEELMKYDDSQVALQCLAQFLSQRVGRNDASIAENKDVGCNGESVQNDVEEVEMIGIQTAKQGDMRLRG